MKLSLSPSGIDDAIKEIQRFKQDLQQKVDLLAMRLADEGVKIVSVKFQNAQYDGTNDVSVHLENRDKGHYAVVATGNAVLFIEFGTGVYYGTPAHPEADDSGMVRGGYGQGHGKQNAWWYYGDLGTNGLDRGAGKVSTRGNPANMSAYTTVKELESKFDTIAKEVFSA